jgi:hypothetical protein
VVWVQLQQALSSVALRHQLASPETVHSMNLGLASTVLAAHRGAPVIDRCLHPKITDSGCSQMRKWS